MLVQPTLWIVLYKLARRYKINDFFAKNVSSFIYDLKSSKMLSVRKIVNNLMEKDIFWINLSMHNCVMCICIVLIHFGFFLVCLQFCGIWSPDKDLNNGIECSRKRFKRRLLEGHKYFFFTFSLLHTVYVWILIYLFFETISLPQISLNFLYGISYLLTIFKATYL